MDTKSVLANSYLYKPYSFLFRLFLFLYLYTRENILNEVKLLNSPLSKPPKQWTPQGSEIVHE